MATGILTATTPEELLENINEIEDEEYAQNLLARMAKQGAVLTCDEMDIIERFWEKDIATRRCTLINLTKPFLFIREQVENDRGFADALANFYVCSQSERYEQIAKLIKQAEVRIGLALACRDDMQEIMDKAKAEQAATA